MRNKHTPEPWRYEWLDTENGWVMATVDGRTVYLAELVTKDGEGLCVSEEEAYENGRRIVAAVNACEGISTKALEAGFIHALLGRCISLLTTRDMPDYGDLEMKADLMFDEYEALKELLKSAKGGDKS